jgi:beta-glucosidase
VAEPGGRLPQTFPVSEAQASFPAAQYPGVGGVARYTDGLLVGYRAYDAAKRKPLFPFGYGLGYTTFSYRGLKVRSDGHRTKVSLVVRNTGDRAGAAVPQVYVGFPRKAGEPPRQLKGFEKIRLDPGASKRVTITLPPRAFARWSTKKGRWVIKPGRYRIFAGPDSRTLPLRGAVRMPGRSLAG